MKKLSITLSALTILIMFSYVFLNFSDIITNPSVTGKPIVNTTLYVYTFNESICNQRFEDGWNLVSFPCLANDLPTDLVFQDLNVSFNLRTYIASDSVDPWKGYNPSLPSWVINDLSDVSRESGYWVYVTNTTLFVFNNSLRTPTSIALVPGWNLVGYPSRSDQDMDSTFNQLIPNFDYVYLYNASDTDKWKEYTWNSSLPSNQDLNYTVRYYGYWIFMLNADTLLIA